MTAQPARQSSISVGDIRLTYLPDGEGHLSATGVFPASTDVRWQPHHQWLDDDGWWVASIGGFLVETGDRKVLVDLGFGDQTFEAPGFARAQGGRYLDSLKQAGVLPEQIDTVVLTHLHSDHTGWISHQGSLTFPNATYLLGSDEEWTFFQEHTDVPFHPGESVRDLENRFGTTSDGQVTAPSFSALPRRPSSTKWKNTPCFSASSSQANSPWLHEKSAPTRPGPGARNGFWAWKRRT